MQMCLLYATLTDVFVLFLSVGGGFADGEVFMFEIPYDGNLIT